MDSNGEMMVVEIQSAERQGRGGYLTTPTLPAMERKLIEQPSNVAKLIVWVVYNRVGGVGLIVGL